MKQFQIELLLIELNILVWIIPLAVLLGHFGILFPKII